MLDRTPKAHERSMVTGLAQSEPAVGPEQEVGAAFVSAQGLDEDAITGRTDAHPRRRPAGIDAQVAQVGQLESDRIQGQRDVACVGGEVVAPEEQQQGGCDEDAGPDVGDHAQRRNPGGQHGDRGVQPEKDAESSDHGVAEERRGDGQHGDRAGQQGIAGAQLAVPPPQAERRYVGVEGPADRLVDQIVDELTQRHADRRGGCEPGCQECEPPVAGRDQRPTESAAGPCDHRHGQRGGREVVHPVRKARDGVGPVLAQPEERRVEDVRSGDAAEHENDTDDQPQDVDGGADVGSPGWCLGRARSWGRRRRTRAATHRTGASSSASASRFRTVNQSTVPNAVPIAAPAMTSRTLCSPK